MLHVGLMWEEPTANTFITTSLRVSNLVFAYFSAAMRDHKLEVLKRGNACFNIYYSHFIYSEGDLVVVFPLCDLTNPNSC